MKHCPSATLGRQPAVPTGALSAPRNDVRIAIALLRRDGGTQIRALNSKVAGDYAAVMQHGTRFPPICAYFDGTDYWLADGFHRISAAIQNHEVAVEAFVYLGTLREAVSHACRANSGFGDWRTANDKRSAVSTLLENPRWAERSDREIARACGVSPDLVGNCRIAVLGIRSAIRTVSRGGRDFPMNVAGIKRTNASRASINAARLKGPTHA